MRLLKGLQKAILASAVMALAFGSAPAKAATSDQPFGACIGAAGGNDCVTAVGHISASVVGTLSINEMRAISFGNFAVPVHLAGAIGTQATIVLDPTGVRTEANGVNASIVLLNGANATGGPAGAGPAVGPGDTGSQSPGHYTVSAGQEGAATQVYISFSDSGGNLIDACSPNGSAGGVYGGAYSGVPGTCDNYHPGNDVILTNPAGGATFTVDQFVFNESGSDVYGHYIDDAAAVGPGSPNPFLPGSGSGSGHNGTPPTGTPGGAGALQAIDVVVGATLHTDTSATAYKAGKFTGIFDIMVSY